MSHCFFELLVSLCLPHGPCFSVCTKGFPGQGLSHLFILCLLTFFFPLCIFCISAFVQLVVQRVCSNEFECFSSWPVLLPLFLFSLLYIGANEKISNELCISPLIKWSTLPCSNYHCLSYTQAQQIIFISVRPATWRKKH